MAVFTMPSLGADMEDGTLVEWMVAIGDTVARGDVVAVVETQKGAIEIECFDAGTVRDLKVAPGTLVPVGAPLAVIGDAADPEPSPAPAQSPSQAPAPPQPPAAKPRAPEITAPMQPAAASPAASPAARLRARELGLDLSAVTGTGPGGAIVLADIDAGRRPPRAASLPTDAKEDMRNAIAAAMARSKQTIPHFYLSQTFDVQPATDHLAALNADRPPAERVLLGALLVRATAHAARTVPTMNGTFGDAGFQRSNDIYVGLAIALRGGGLVAPAIMEADRLSLDDTMAAMRDLVSRARAGRLRGSEMTRGTITMTSLGEQGAEAMGGIIFPPQVALAGLGAPQTRPWVVDGAVVARKVVTLTLSVDHRVNDGRQAARFAAAFEHHLTHPETP